MLQFTDYKTKVYTILVVDLDECYCADVYSDGEIVKRFGEHSSVPNKHKKGGQSAQRFARIRENEIVHWFKRINEYMKPIKNEIYLGISFVYKKRFLNYLNTDNQNKIKEIRRNEYSGLTGIYQYINKLNEKLPL